MYLKFSSIDEYESHRQSRIDRFRARAQKRTSQADATFSSGREMMDCIPMGQPIHIGHHSEKRDRAFRDRIDRKIRKFCVLNQQAEHADQCADAAESNESINSNDPGAIEKLKTRIAELEARQSKMKTWNAAYRAGKLSQLIGEEEAARVAASIATAGWDKRPYPSYTLQNNNANIRRLKLRLANLERAAKVTVEQATIFESDSGHIVHNPINGRLELHFDAKPPKAAIESLRSSGWILRRYAGQWYWLGSNDESGLSLAKQLLA